MIEEAVEWLPHWPTVNLTDNEYYELFVELNPHLFVAYTGCNLPTGIGSCVRTETTT